MAIKKITLLSPSKERQKRIRRIIDTGPETTMALKKTFLIGNGVDDNYTVSHNLNTRDVVVQVRENFGDFSQIQVGITYDSVNTFSLDMGDIISSNSYLVIVVG
jgi:hypothetical protein